MMDKYEAPELEIVLIDYDVLTASDNDASFSDDDEYGDWGQYY